MLRTKSLLTIGIAVTTVGLWGLLGWRLLLAGGVIPGTVTSSWQGLARRSAWAHWVNGSPTIREGKAQLVPGQLFEIAVQPIAVCANLLLTTKSDGQIMFTSRDTGALQPENGFLTSSLPRAFDGYHFLIATDTAVDLHSFQFTCHP